MKVEAVIAEQVETLRGMVGSVESDPFRALLKAKHGSQEWKELRRNFLGASEAPAACGQDKWKSRYKLYREKRGEIPETEDNEAMLWGRLLERVVAEEACRRAELTFKAAGRPVQDERYPWRIATPDAWVEDRDGKVGLLQIKTTSAYNMEEWKDSPEDRAHIQIAHEMAVTGADFCYLAVLIGGNTLKVYRVERDLDLEASVLELELQFWEWLQRETPPPVCGQDLELLRTEHPTGSPVVVEAPHLESAVKVFLREKELEKGAKDRKEHAEATLKKFMGDAETMISGRYRVTWRGAKKRTFNVKEMADGEDK